MKVLFLDRDGVINVDHGYVSKIEDFKFIDGIFDLCTNAINNGYKIIVVTNQTGIAFKKYTLEDFLNVNQYMINEFKKKNIEILDVFYCMHNPSENCMCHKPKPGMIIEACKKYDIDLDNSILIGDKITDAQCAYNGHVKNIYLFNNDQKTTFECKNIKDFKEVIL